jgi:hypothetical protein
MPRRLNIGFSQGPTTLYAPSGNYGILAPPVSLVKAGSPPPTSRRWKPGWGPVLNNSQIYGGSGGSYIGIPNNNTVAAAGPCAPGVTMIVAPHAWNEFEPNGKTDPPGTGPGQRFSGLIPILGNEIAQAANFANPATGPNNPILYIVRIIFKTQHNFGSTNPLPADIAGLATAISGGFSAWRWNSTFVSRYDDLCSQIGALYGSNTGNNVYFGGIMTQETATSFTPNGTTDGYTDASFQSALISEAASIANALPYGRPYFMINDWPTTNLSVAAGTIQLATVCKNIQQYGAIIGFPDLATTTSVVGRYYALIQACHNGGTFTNSAGSVTMPGKFGTYGCIQPAEWGGNPPSHGSGPGDYPVNLPNLVNYATSSFTFKPSAGYAGALDWTGGAGRTSLLNLDSIMPDWHTSDTSSPNTGGPSPPIVFNSSATKLITALPSFGTVTPNP